MIPLVVRVWRIKLKSKMRCSTVPFVGLAIIEYSFELQKLGAENLLKFGGLIKLNFML